MGAGEIRAGKAYVELGTKDAALVKGLDSAKRRLATFASGLQQIGVGMSAVGALIITPLIAATKQFADSGSAIYDMSQRTGRAAEELSVLAYAAAQTGTSLEDVEKAIRAAQKQGGNGDLAEIADQLAAVDDAGKRTALAMKLMGKSGAALIPMLSGGRAGLADYARQAERLGLVMDSPTAEAADRLGDAIEDLRRVGLSAFRVLGAAVAPLAEAWANRAMRVGISLRGWIKDNQALVESLAVIGATLATVGAQTLVFAGIIKAASISVGTIASAIGVLKVAGAALPGIIQAVVGLGSALLAAVGGEWIVLAIAAVAAIALIGTAIKSLVGNSAELRTAFQDIAVEAAAVRESHQKLADELSSLAGKQSITHAEWLREIEILAELKEKYGEFGISIDDGTGRIIAAADAWERLEAAMADVEFGRLSDAAMELRNNIAELGDEIHSAWTIKGIADASKRQLEEFAKLGKIIEKMNALRKFAGRRASEPEPEFPYSKEDAAAAKKQEDRDFARFQKEAGGIGSPDTTAAQNAKTEREMQHELEMIRISGIENEHEREMAAIKARYDFQISEEDRLAGVIYEREGKLVGTEEQLAAFRRANILREQRAAELANAEMDEQLQLAKKQQDIERRNGQIGYEADEARLRATLKGHDLQQALLDLEKQRTLEEAKREGLDVGRLEELFGWRQKELDLSAQVDRISVAGTFNPEALWGLEGNGADERTARATEESAQFLKQLVQAAQVSDLVFVGP